MVKRAARGAPDGVVESLETGYGREFRLYAIGQAVSIAGDRIALITLVFLIIHLSHSVALSLALFYACRVVPTLVGGLVAGVVADHFSRKRLMIWSDLARAALLALVPALSVLSLATLYPLVIVLYAFTLLFSTASAAALPDIVPDLRMMGANAILSGIKNASDIAYAFGGALIVALGFQAPFYIDAATFLFSAVMISLMRMPAQRRAPRALELRELGRRIRAGAGFIADHPFLRWSMLPFVIAPAAGGIGYVLAPLYASKVLARSPWLFGPLRNGAFRFSVLEVSLGMGALTGSVVAARLARGGFGPVRGLPRGRLFGIGLLGTGVADALLAATTNLYLAAGFLALSGLMFSLFIISGMTLAQTLTPTELRGRVVAARVTAINGALLVGSLVGGLALLALSVRTLWLIEGTLIAAASLAVWLRPEVRNQA